MPGMNGIELQGKLTAEGHHFPIIFVTAFPGLKARAQALASGAIGFLAKPFSDEILITCLNKALGEEHLAAFGNGSVLNLPRFPPSSADCGLAFSFAKIDRRRRTFVLRMTLAFAHAGAKFFCDWGEPLPFGSDRSCTAGSAADHRG